MHVKYIDKFFKILESLASQDTVVFLWVRCFLSEGMPVTSCQGHVFILVHYYCFPGFCAYVLSHSPTSVSCLLYLG